MQIFSSKAMFMTKGKQSGLSAAHKSDLWCRRKARDSLHKIGRTFGNKHSSIHCLVSRRGFVPAVRRRSLLALTQHEREENLSYFALVS